jgi:hypothetical protein
MNPAGAGIMAATFSSVVDGKFMPGRKELYYRQAKRGNF